MKIAMLGTRGIPGSHGGFETCVEQLSTRLVERGHEVTVYCRPHMIDFEGSEYKGVRLIKIPTVASKHLDTFVHTGLCTFHLVTKGRCDVVLYFVAGNSPFCFLPRLIRIPTAINVDGMDSKRAKWNRAAKVYLRFAEWLAPHAASETIADSRFIQQYYKEHFKAESVYIPYGAVMEPAPGTEWLDKFGLKQRDYVLFVGRLVPENWAHVLIEAYRGLETGKKLVIVGDAPYADEYVKKLKFEAAHNVVFTGYLFGEGYRQLSQNAYVAVAPSIAGGTHPVIVESMAAGNCVVVSDHPPNLEVIGEVGVSFSRARGAADLRAKLQMLLEDSDMVAGYREKARRRAAEHYSWDAVTDEYENLCRRLAGK